MKRLLIIIASAAMLSSCAMLQKSTVQTRDITTPPVYTATVASLDVRPERISYTYYPKRSERKNLSLNDLKRNAIYAALAANNNADELVQVNYYIQSKRCGFKKKIVSISLSGYPAYYKNFRNPTETDLKTIETLARTEMYNKAKITHIGIGNHCVE